MSYFLTADKDVNMKAIFEAMNTFCVLDSDSDSDSDLHFSSRLSFFCEYLIILAQRGKNRSGD